MIRPPLEVAQAAILPPEQRRISDVVSASALSTVPGPIEVQGEAKYDPAEAKKLLKYLARRHENAILANQMGLYFYQLCKMRNSMGREHLTKLLNEQRKIRLDMLKALKETRDDKRKDPDRKGGGRVRGNGNR